MNLFSYKDLNMEAPEPEVAPGEENDESVETPETTEEPKVMYIRGSLGPLFSKMLIEQDREGRTSPSTESHMMLTGLPNLIEYENETRPDKHIYATSPEEIEEEGVVGLSEKVGEDWTEEPVEGEDSAVVVVKDLDDLGTTKRVALEGLLGKKGFRVVDMIDYLKRK